MARAATLGVRDVYLYTNGSEHLYPSLGWRTLSREPYLGRDVTLMTSRLPELEENR